MITLVPQLAVLTASTTMPEGSQILCPSHHLHALVFGLFIKARIDLCVEIPPSKEEAIEDISIKIAVFLM